MPQLEFANQKVLIAYAEQNDLAYEYEYTPAFAKRQRRGSSVLRGASRRQFAGCVAVHERVDGRSRFFLSIAPIPFSPSD